MNNPQTQEEDYGVSLEQAQAVITEGEKVFRLMQNKDFQDIIMNGFIKQSALNKVSLLAVPSMQEHKDNIILELEAISILDGFLRNIQNTSIEMKKSLAEFEEDQRTDIEVEAEEA